MLALATIRERATRKERPARDSRKLEFVPALEMIEAPPAPREPGPTLELLLALADGVWPGSPHDAMVYLALASSAFGDERHLAWPSIRELARRARVSRASVMRSLRQLELHGLVMVDRGSGRQSLYRLDSEALRRLAEQSNRYQRATGCAARPVAQRYRNRSLSDTGTGRFLRHGESVQGDKKRERRTRSNNAFVPPGPDEVQAHLDALGERRFTGARFCAYYENRNWLVGKLKMHDWRRAVATWRSRENDRPGAQPAGLDAQRLEYARALDAAPCMDVGEGPLDD